MTAGVSIVMEQDYSYAKFIHQSIKRHINWEFGDIDPEDMGSNEQAILYWGVGFSSSISSILVLKKIRPRYGLLKRLIVLI